LGKIVCLSHYSKGILDDGRNIETGISHFTHKKEERREEREGRKPRFYHFLITFSRVKVTVSKVEYVIQQDTLTTNRCVSYDADADATVPA